MNKKYIFMVYKYKDSLEGINWLSDEEAIELSTKVYNYYGSYFNNDLVVYLDDETGASWFEDKDGNTYRSIEEYYATERDIKINDILK